MKTGLSAYVAAPFEDWQRARDMMNRLRSIGFSISFDWTKDADKGEDVAPTARLQAAYDDRHGAEDADVFVLLTPESKDKGCAMWTELGFALAAGAYCIATGPMRDRNLFSVFVHKKLAEDAMVTDHLAEWLAATREAAA